ncbi:MAG: stage sporulation protein, partial [Oscillospiraceae bacterium]|nr:stage sporulation protein [Oscillospiraceae bacterium]
MRKFLRTVASLCTVLTIAVMGATAYFQCNLPDSFYVVKGKELYINSKLSITSNQVKEQNSVLSAAKNANATYNVQLKLFGIIPIKQSKVDVVSRTLLVPCGTPFGVKLTTEGVLVVGMNEIQTENG